MNDDPTVQAMKAHSDRQDRRLDNHGDRLAGLERRESAMAEKVTLLQQSLDGLRSDVRTAIGALIVMGVGQIVIQRLFT